VDVNTLIDMLWSKDVRNACQEIEDIKDPVVVDRLIDLLERRSEFIEKTMKRYYETWQGKRLLHSFNDIATSDFTEIQIRAIRIFGKFGGEKAVAYLKTMTDNDPDSDVREDASRYLRRLQETSK
jgi:HEAT repeat protein